MKQVLDFLNTSKVFYLATMDGAQPRVRPLGFVMEWNGKLAFCTSNQKAMYRQLMVNPKVEISCVDSEMNTLRIIGEAVFVTSEEAQRRALEVMPNLSHMYAVGDGKFEIFCLEHASAIRSAIGGDSTSMTL